jgi:hypothetical protein
MRIQDRRMLEGLGDEKRAAKILIDPPLTADELRRADEMLDAIRQAAERNLFEKEGGERTFDEWLAEWSADAWG